MDKKTLLFIACCVSAFALGILTAASGPAIPEIASHTQSALDNVGAAFSGLFAGALLGQIISGQVYDRLGARPVIVGGLIAGTIGAFIIATSTTLLGLALGTFVAGMGQGTIDVTLHLIVGSLYPQNSVRPLNLLNVFFGVGTVAAGLFASWTLTQYTTALPNYLVGSAVMGVLTVIFFVSGRIATYHHDEENDQPEKAKFRLYRSQLLWLCAGVIFLYVGVENVLGSWMPTYMTRTTALDVSQAALTVSTFWGALTVGRIIASIWGNRLSPQRLMLVCLVGSAVGGALFVIGIGNVALTWLSIIVSGLSFGPVFPTMMSLIAGQFRNASGRATSLVMAGGSLGSASLVWLNGVILQNINTTTSAIFTGLLGAGMLVLFVFTRWDTDKNKNHSGDKILN